MAEKGIDLLLSMVRQADTAALMMSRMHCHAKNLSSIVLRRASGGRLTRAFLAWPGPGHRLHTNRLDDDLEVGIHDHRYPLWLSLIHGDVENVVYDRAPSGSLLEWRFRTGVESGTPTKELIASTAGLVESSREPILPAKWVGLLDTALHNVEVRGTAAWLVQEGGEVKETTTLFTRREFSIDGLYQTFKTRQDIVSHVLAWATEARK